MVTPFSQLPRQTNKQAKSLEAPCLPLSPTPTKSSWTDLEKYPKSDHFSPSLQLSCWPESPSSPSWILAMTSYLVSLLPAFVPRRGATVILRYDVGCKSDQLFLSLKPCWLLVSRAKAKVLAVTTKCLAHFPSVLSGSTPTTLASLLFLQNSRHVLNTGPFLLMLPLLGVFFPRFYLANSLPSTTSLLPTEGCPRSSSILPSAPYHGVWPRYSVLFFLYNPTSFCFIIIIYYSR